MTQDTNTQGQVPEALQEFEVRKLAAIGLVHTSSGLVERRPIEYRRELEDQFVRGYRAAEKRLHAQVAALTQPAQVNTKTHDLLSMMIGLFLGAKETIGYKPGGAIDNIVAEAVDHLKDWPYPQPSPTPQADSQPATVQDYPPLPECQGKIFDDGYWIQNKLGPKHYVMGGAKVWLESQVHEAIDADRAARAPADSVLEDAMRYRWLFGARTKEQVENFSDTVMNPLPQDDVLSMLQCFFRHKAGVDAVVDAARKQGGV